MLVDLDQTRDIWNLGEILGLTPINPSLTVYRINRGQPLKLGQNLKKSTIDGLKPG